MHRIIRRDEARIETLEDVRAARRGGRLAQDGERNTTGSVLSGSRAALAARLLEQGLSQRECELALLDFAGLTRLEIADRLHLSPTTIKTYWRRIYAKLSIQQRSTLRQWLHAQSAVDNRRPTTDDRR